MCINKLEPRNLIRYNPISCNRSDKIFISKEVHFFSSLTPNVHLKLPIRSCLFLSYHFVKIRYCVTFVPRLIYFSWVNLNTLKSGPVLNYFSTEVDKQITLERCERVEYFLHLWTNMAQSAFLCAVFVVRMHPIIPNLMACQ